MIPKFNKNQLLFLAILLSLCHFSNAQQERPNILVILCDDLGYADVGFNGSIDISTPELDKLAQNGTVMTSAYVAHPFCGPSRAALMTGRYPHKIGAPFNLPHNMGQEQKNELGVMVKETYISSVLQKSGYYTGLVGKWHLGEAKKYHPNERGFDDFYGFLGGGHDYFPDQYRKAYEQQRKAGNKMIRDYILPLEHNGKTVHESEYLTDALTAEAIRFTKEAEQNKKPFFLYLAYNAPHVPLQAKDEDLAVFSNIEDKDRRTYAAMVYAVDRGVGKIVQALKDNGQYDNTLIVFFSDNGGNTDHGANNFPLKGKKGDTWEGGIRVPMFMHWPDHVQKGQYFDHPISALDLYPTLTKLAGAQLQENKKLDGKDIWSSILTGRNPYENEMIHTLRHRHGYNDVGGRWGDWKITRMGNEPWRLHHLIKDVGEEKNLAGRYPDKLRQMVAKTEEWTKNFVHPLWFYSAKDQELWSDGRMPDYDQTFEIDKLVLPPKKK